MLTDPRHWQGHYHAGAGDLRVQRHFGLADRIRYYWPQPAAQAGVAAVLGDLAGKALPGPLLWQAFPGAVLDRAESLDGDRPTALTLASIQLALEPYFFDLPAARPKEPVA